MHAGWSASCLAEARLAAGDLSAAVDAAREAITWCGRSLRGAYEALAQSVLARALRRRDGVAARASAEAALRDAAALIERTGARLLAPALLEWRAALAAALGDDRTHGQLLQAARRDYEDLGAPKQAERLAAQGTP